MNFSDKTFGVEFEGFGVRQTDLKTALRNAGINADTASYSNRDASYWRIKHDGSIRGSNGFEIVSPILQGEAGLNEMNTVLRVANELGADVNSSCGFHVHWGVRGWNLGNFRNLGARYVKFERALDSLMPKSRRQNNAYYCQGWLTGSVSNKESVANAWKKWSGATTIRGMMEKFARNRYTKLNLSSFWSHGTVEFRHHSGTFDYEKAECWIRFTRAMVEQADKREKLQGWKTGLETNKVSLTKLLTPMVKNGYLPKRVARFYKARQTHFDTLRVS